MLFFGTAFGSEGPLYSLDCPFFLKWSVDWQACMVQWNTYYGLTIVLLVLGIVVTAIIVAVWKVYKNKTRHERTGSGKKR